MRLCIFRSILAFCCLLLVGLFFALLWRPAPEKPFERRFTFIAPTSQWFNLASGLLDAADRYHVSVKLLGSASLDPDAQIQAINDTVLTLPDGIITVAAGDPERFAQAVGGAAERDIPVVLVDSDFPDSGRLCYIGTDNTAAGKLAGRDMIEATGGSARVAIITASLDAANHRERVESFCDSLAEHPDMEIAAILECHSEPMEMAEMIPQLLERDPDINAFYLTEGMASTVVGDLLQSFYPERSFAVVTFDLFRKTREYLSSGLYYSAISQQPYAEGYLSVETLCRYLDGEIPESILYTGVSSSRDAEDAVLTHDVGKEMTWYPY